MTDYDDSYERAEAMEMAQDRADEERADMQTLLDAKDRRIAELEAGLREALELVRHEPTWLSEEESATTARLKQLLPSEET